MMRHQKHLTTPSNQHRQRPLAAAAGTNECFFSGINRICQITSLISSECASRSPLNGGLGSFARRDTTTGDQHTHSGARSHRGRHQMGSVRSTQPLLTAFLVPERGMSSPI